MNRLTAAACLLAFSAMVAASAGAWAAVPLVGASGGEEQPESQEIPDDLTREEVRDLLSKLSDDQVRELLMRELDENAVDADAEAPNEVGAVDRLHGVVDRTRVRLTEALNSWSKLSRVPGQIWSQATMAGIVSSWSIVLGIVLMFAAGLIAEVWLRRATGIGRAPPADSAPGSFVARLGASVMRALTEILALLVFGVAAFAVMFVAVWGKQGAEPLFVMLLSLTVIVRSIAILMDVVLAPRAPGLRLVFLDDEDARALRWRLLILAGIVVMEAIFRDAMGVFGVDVNASTLFVLIMVAVFVIAVIVMIWQARHRYAAIIRGHDGEPESEEGGFVNTLAAYWHLIAIATVLVLYVVGLTRIGAERVETDYPGTKTLVLLLLLPLIDVGLRRIVTRMFKPKDEEKDGSGAAESSLLTLVPASAAEVESKKTASREIQAVVLKNLRIVLGFIAVLIVMSFWDIEVGDVAKAIAGERVGTAFFDIVVTVLLAYAIWSVVKAAVSYHMGPDEASGGEDAAGSEGDIGGAGQTRVQTLLPLFRKIILITLLIMGILLVLSSVGVNIGPLIAGAGVVGIAIGFGAQSLVRDVVSGVFFLLDDAFRMGEYVEIGDVRGVVEAISVRSLRLRHHNGPLHTIPFGEIKHLTNYSRDWAIMKFELRLPFETDINKVRKIIKTVGQEMEHDDELAPLMLAPLKSQGVNRMEDSALIVRCKFTAVPGQQFYVRREAFTRIQKAFEEHGIRFAPKRVIVEAATPELAVAGAAALESEDAQASVAKKPDDRG